MITETDRLSAAIDQAAVLWPELAEKRTLLLRKVLDIGVEQVEQSAAALTNARQSQISRVAGSLDNVWPESWREELAADWPA